MLSILSLPGKLPLPHCFLGKILLYLLCGLSQPFSPPLTYLITHCSLSPALLGNVSSFGTLATAVPQPGTPSHLPLLQRLLTLWSRTSTALPASQALHSHICISCEVGDAPAPFGEQFLYTGGYHPFRHPCTQAFAFYLHLWYKLRHLQRPLAPSASVRKKQPSKQTEVKPGQQFGSQFTHVTSSYRTKINWKGVNKSINIPTHIAASGYSIWKHREHFQHPIITENPIKQLCSTWSLRKARGKWVSAVHSGDQLEDVPVFLASLSQCIQFRNSVSWNKSIWKPLSSSGFLGWGGKLGNSF